MVQKIKKDLKKKQQYAIITEITKINQRLNSFLSKVKNMKKILLLIFALVYILALASCKNSNASDTPGSNDESGICRSASMTEYTIVFSSDATDAERKSVQNLKASIERKTGAKIDVSDDWTKKGEDPNNDSYEILVGLTNRDASQKVRNEVRYEDFLIRNDGKKIVIFAHNTKKLQEALGCFSANLKRIEDSYYWEEEYFFRADYELNNTTLLGSPIYEYVVAIPEKASVFEKLTAEKITQIIAKKCGYMIPNVTASSELSEKTIFIGSHNGIVGSYSGEVEGTKCLLKANNSASFVSLWNYFDTLLRGDNGTCELSDKIMTFSQNGNVSLHATAAGSDLRVITSNVLFSDKGTLDLKNRMLCLAETYLTYLPDVIGLQEARPAEVAELLPYLRDLYASVTFTAADGKAVYQQILYRKDIFELKDCGFTRFRANVLPWGVSWAVLERKSDGKMFALTNTHSTVMADTYDPGKDNNTDGVVHRIANCETVLQTISDIRAKYPGIPIMSTGDWNGKDGSESLSPMNSSSLMKNAMTHATVSADTTTNSAHTIDKMPGNTGNTIDHIFFTDDVLSALVHDVIVNDVVIMGSDHCPVYVDFKFK